MADFILKDKVPAEKTIRLASSTTNGKNGSMATVLTKWMTLFRLVGLPLRKLLNRSAKLLELDVTSVESAVSGN
jgi:hypothetical protein